jgi:MFS transporter, PPP family, 3-phenylpropionic acid transporter
MKKIWPFSFYFLYYAAAASLIPFIVLFYQDLKFNGTQIGLLTGIPPLITLFAAPFWTSVADATRRHRLIMSLGIGVAVVAMLILQSLTTFVLVFIIIIIYNFFYSPISSLSDSATMSMLGEDKSMYGRLRLGGTIGWGVFSWIAGVLVDNFGLRIAFWCFSLLAFANLFVAQKVVHDTTAHEQSNHQGIRYFLTSRRWLLFLFSTFLGGLSSVSVTVYLFPYMAELGVRESVMGIAFFLATITEFPIFFFGNYLVKRFKSEGLFMLALVLMGIRSLFFAWVSAPAAVLVVQALGGTIFPAMWLAGVAYADAHAPVGLKSTAQGLFAAMTFGIGSAVGGFIGGLLLESIGGRGMYLVFGVIILVGLAVVEIVKRVLPGEETPQSVI